MKKFDISLVYIGNNNPKEFKRGVENVIKAQACAAPFHHLFYLFFSCKRTVFRWDNMICIGIPEGWLKYFNLNMVLYLLKKKYGKIFIHSHGPVKTVMIMYNTHLLTVHDAIYYQRKGLHQPFYYIFYLIEKLAYLRSYRIHFISNYAKSQSLLPTSSDKSIVIFNTSNYEINSSLVECSNSTFQLLAVRGIEERTRIDLLIDFADWIQKKTLNGKTIFIKVAGKGPMLQYYRQLIIEKGLKNIQLLGFVTDNDLISLYRSCDMVIMPCEHAEGFGLPIIEGYMFGKPVIASNKCAVPEIIYSHDYLFENTPESIWKTISTVVKRKIDFRSFYFLRYSNHIYQEKMVELYQSLINKYL